MSARTFVKLPISAKGANRKTLRCFYFDTTKRPDDPTSPPFAFSVLSIEDRALLIQFLWPPEKDIVDRDRTIKRWEGQRRWSRKEDSRTVIDRIFAARFVIYTGFYLRKGIKVTNVAIKNRSRNAKNCTRRTRKLRSYSGENGDILIKTKKLTWKGLRMLIWLLVC